MQTNPENLTVNVQMMDRRLNGLRSAALDGVGYRVSVAPRGAFRRLGEIGLSGQAVVIVCSQLDLCVRAAPDVGEALQFVEETCAGELSVLKVAVVTSEDDVYSADTWFELAKILSERGKLCVHNPETDADEAERACASELANHVVLLLELLQVPGFFAPRRVRPR